MYSLPDASLKIIALIYGSVQLGEEAVHGGKKVIRIAVGYRYLRDWASGKNRDIGLIEDRAAFCELNIVFPSEHSVRVHDDVAKTLRLFNRLPCVKRFAVNSCYLLYVEAG